MSWMNVDLLSELLHLRAPWRIEGWELELPPLAKPAWRVKRHFEDVVTYIKHQLTNAVAEGLNSKIQALKSAARGFRNFQNYRFTENLPARSERLRR